MRLSDDDISAIIEREIQQAQGYDSDVLSSKRQSALNYYSGIMPAPAEGGSVRERLYPGPDEPIRWLAYYLRGMPRCVTDW